MNLLSIIMERNMSNKKVVILTVAIIAGMLIIPTIYKVHIEHNNRLIKVVEKEFLYYAKKCYYENACSSTVTLNDLYEKGYINEELANPITKKYYDTSSYVDIKTEEITFIE